MTSARIITAAMLAIGDELLSGRTKDRNIGHLADMLFLAGIDLQEVRIVGDEEDLIVEALNALRGRYDYVFTSGGIGPRAIGCFEGGTAAAGRLLPLRGTAGAIGAFSTAAEPHCGQLTRPRVRWPA